MACANVGGLKGYSVVEADAREGVAAKGADLKTLDLDAQGLTDRRVGNRGDRDLLLEQLLGLFVQDGSLFAVSEGSGFFDQCFVGAVAPPGVVVGTYGVTAVKGAEPVVGVAVVTLSLIHI